MSIAGAQLAAAPQDFQTKASGSEGVQGAGADLERGTGIGASSVRPEEKVESEGGKWKGPAGRDKPTG